LNLSFCCWPEHPTQAISSKTLTSIRIVASQEKPRAGRSVRSAGSQFIAFGAIYLGGVVAGAGLLLVVELLLQPTVAVTNNPNRATSKRFFIADSSVRSQVGQPAANRRRPELGFKLGLPLGSSRYRLVFGLSSFLSSGGFVSPGLSPSFFGSVGGGGAGGFGLFEVVELLWQPTSKPAAMNADNSFFMWLILSESVDVPIRSPVLRAAVRFL
jgi:hypothetical protein